MQESAGGSLHEDGKDSRQRKLTDYRSNAAKKSLIVLVVLVKASDVRVMSSHCAG